MGHPEHERSHPFDDLVDSIAASYLQVRKSLQNPNEHHGGHEFTDSEAMLITIGATIVQRLEMFKQD